MATEALAAGVRPFHPPRLPILTLLHPREVGLWALAALAAGVGLGALEMSQLGWQTIMYITPETPSSRPRAHQARHLLVATL